MNGTSVSRHFGRTRGFVTADIIDGEIKNKEFVTNTFTGHAAGNHDHNHAHGEGHQHEHAHGEGRQHGHGHGQGHGHSHRRILDALQQCDVVVSGGMGGRMYQDFCNAGKKVYIVDETDIDQVLQLLTTGKLVDRPEKSCH